MVYNGILMETIGISVMVSIGLLLLFFSSDIRAVNQLKQPRRQERANAKMTNKTVFLKVRTK